MELIPDWAPNLHPMIVHFPIALLLAAIGADLMALVLRRWTWLRPATVALYVVGGASAVLTYFTGTWAAEAVSVPAAAEAVLSEHADLGWWTMWFFGVYALVRLGVHLWPRTRSRLGVRAGLLVLALGGGYLLYETGDHGAEMVFRHGVGVQAPQAAEASVDPGLTVGESGWRWRPQSDTAWADRITWLEGAPSDVESRLDTTDTGTVSLQLTSQAPVLFVVPDTLGAVQVTAELNRDDFQGTVSLLHHVQDARNYDLFAVGEQTAQYGRRSEGEVSVFDEATVKTDGWQTFRSVGDGTHFRGYRDGEMIVHPHGDAAAPGVVGLHLEGRGTVRLRRLTAEAL